MRVQSRLVFNTDLQISKAILVPLGLPFDASDTLQVVELFTDTEQYSSLLDKLHLKSIDFSEHTTNIYSEEELTASEVLCMIPTAYCGYPEPSSNGEYINLSYDVNLRCVHCEQIKTQIHPLRMNKPKMGRNQISAVYWIDEFVIVHSLKDLFEREGIKGCDFWPIFNHKKNIEWEDIYQIKISSILPPMCSEAIVRSDIPACECGSEGYKLKGTPIYDRVALGQMTDFNKTSEWLGASHQTRQNTIVSKKVYNIFTENKIRGVKFIPVEIRE